MNRRDILLGTGGLLASPFVAPSVRAQGRTEIQFWYGLGAPGGTPKTIIAALSQELARILKQPELQKRLRSFDLDAAYSTPDEFAQRIVREIAMWSKVKPGIASTDPTDDLIAHWSAIKPADVPTPAVPVPQPAQ